MRNSSHAPDMVALVYGIPGTLLITGLTVAGLFELIRVPERTFAAFLVSAGIGIGLIFFAKLPLYRARRFLSPGFRALRGGHLLCYRVGWIFVAAALAFAALILSGG